MPAPRARIQSQTQPQLLRTVRRCRRISALWIPDAWLGRAHRLHLFLCAEEIVHTFSTPTDRPASAADPALPLSRVHRAAECTRLGRDPGYPTDGAPRRLSCPASLRGLARLGSSLP